VLLLSLAMYALLVRIVMVDLNLQAVLRVLHADLAIVSRRVAQHQHQILALQVITARLLLVVRSRNLVPRVVSVLRVHQLGD